MEKIQKKIIMISLILNFIWLFFLLIIYFIFYLQNESKIDYIETNSV